MMRERRNTRQARRRGSWNGGGDASRARHSSNVELKPRREAHRNTRERVRERRLVAKSPKRPTTLVPPPEDPVKRRLLKKTEMRNDESVMNVDENLLNVVSILTKEENIPNEDNEMPKFTVLDDYEEMMKGKQKEYSLKEMGTMTVVKRTEAVGKKRFKRDG